MIVEYKYNDQGFRTEKKVTKDEQTTTTNYFLDGDKVLRETSTDGKNIDYFYDIDGKLTGFSYNNKIYLYLRNLQGDITKIVDTTGIIVVEYTYNAWGNILNTTDDSGINLSEINPYRYRGYRYDEETGFYYLNSRYYNPEIGRFINADGLVGQTGDILSHNKYAYCQNNPVMMVDPSGYKLKWMEKATNWIKGAYDDTTDWLNKTPDNSFTIPSSGDIAPSVLYSLYGISFSTKSKMNGSKELKIASAVLAYGALALDIGNTWFDEDSSNTNLQRIQKTGIQLAGFGAQVGVGYVGADLVVVGTAAAVPTYGSSLLVSCAGIMLVMEGGYYIQKGQDYLYDKYNID